MNKLRVFFEDNFSFVIKMLIGLFVLYWFFYFLTPKTQMSNEDKSKLELLIKKIDDLQKKQNKIDSTVIIVDKELEMISDSLSKIKTKKVIVREIYHEKIINIRKFNDIQLDSFFTERYGYNPG